ncbi:MAG TPA: YncE family protein [Acidobacteriaceae bacterium]|jgi:YVTN family beta-propeller protein|nr:YncE family protein [Acidobacteriaceae bacterium]
MRFKSSQVIPWVAAALISMCAAYPAVAQTTPQRSLLALSKRNHTLAIVDPATLQVIARAPVGPDPHEVIASADGKTAYVSIYGGGRYHALSVIDLVAQKALPDVDTGALNGPHGLAFVGGKLWFTAEGAKAIARYDPATARIDWIMGTGQNRTHMIYVSPDQKRIYTTNVSSGTVSFLQLVTLPPMGPPPGMRLPAGAMPPPPPGGGQPRMDWNETIIPVGKGDEGFDVSPDGRELWTANAQDGTLSIIDTTSNHVTATLDARIFGANRLRFTPDGKLVLISSLGNGDLFVYDAASRKEIKRILIGHGAAGILMDAIANRAFVACSPDNSIAIVDLKTLEVTGHLDVGGEPDGLAWAVRP